MQRFDVKNILVHLANLQQVLYQPGLQARDLGGQNGAFHWFSYREHASVRDREILFISY